MARLREPDEVKTKRTTKEPTSWSVRQTRGLPNTAQDREKLKLEREKLTLQQQNKEADRSLKIQQHGERMAAMSAKSEEAQRTREDVAHEKWSTDLRKQQEKDNIQDFQNFLYENYGGVIDDKGTRGIPLDIEKRAARYSRMARTDGAGAIQKFKNDYSEEQTLRQQYQTVLPELIKARQKALGVDVLPPGEVASLDKADVDTMRRAVTGFQAKQDATKARSDAELAQAGKDYNAAYPDQNVAGGKPRYTADEFGGSGFGGNLPVRSDLKPGEAAEAYDDVVDRAVASKGGGFLPTAAGAFLKYAPGARDLIDPNTPIRQGVRQVGEIAAPFLRAAGDRIGEAAAGTWDNIKRGEGGGATAADLVPNFETPQAAPASPVIPTAEPKAAPVANTASAAPPPAPGGAVPDGTIPEASAPVGFGGLGSITQSLQASPEVVAARRERAAAAGAGATELPGIPQETGVPALKRFGGEVGKAVSEAPGTSETLAQVKTPNIFAGLADTVKGIFTASPEDMERRQNIWASMAQDARSNEAPVDGTPNIRFPASPGHVRQVEPGNFPNGLASPAKRPEDEDRAFPKAM